MPSLKDLRNRLRSVKQTQKITSAMKLVAASKLRRAQEQAEASRPFAERMSDMLANLSASVADIEGAPPLRAGPARGGGALHWLCRVTADRGRCGGFNSSIARGARNRIRELRGAGKQVKVLCIGRKGRDMLRREFGALIVDTIEGIGRRRLEFAEAVGIGERLERMYEAGEFDVCTIGFNRFRSAVSQDPPFRQLIPGEPAEIDQETADVRPVYEFEPDEQTILTEL